MRGSRDKPFAGDEDPYFCRVYEAAKGCTIGFECVAEEIEIGEVDTGRDVFDIRWTGGDAAVVLIAGIIRC
jgi:hypothetical protein